MMKENEGEHIDLELSLGNSNETKWVNERGASVNAGPRMDMPFASSHPLSELVWSTPGGLSLKCWNVRPTPPILPPPQTIISTAPTTPLVYGHFIGNTTKEEMNKTKEEEEEGKGKSVAAEALPILQEAVLPNEQKSEYCLISNAPLEKLESFAENNLYQKSGERLPVIASPTNLYRRKGKEKALSGSNVAEEGSRESVESSNSAGPFGKRKESLNLQESISGRHKRARKEIISYTPDNISTLKHDSSFMNWISNMVKGYARVKHEHDPSTRQLQDKDTGFHTMFQSLYRPDIRVSKGNLSRIEGSNEPSLDNKSSVQITDKSNIEGHIDTLRIMPVNVAPMKEEVSEDDKASTDQKEENHNVGSLWITRLATKNLSNDEGVKDNQKPLDTMHPPKYKKSSEAIASVFAKRLDALKYISPLEIIENDATCRPKTCLFCGIHGHDIHHCSDTTESDLAALLRNINSYEGSSSCLCLLCFQVDHWANTCPLRSSKRRHKLKENIVSSVKEKAIDSNSLEYILKETQEIFVGKQISSSDVPKDMFDAIRKIRLSRVEILKWMNSNVPLDGFFIRIRLRKCEAGQRGTGYHVACITTGEEIKHSAKDSKNSISVNVGGIQCFAGIQYISNHDFLEDELVTWWCETSRNSAKVPSKQDLNSKFQERIKFGL